MPSEKVLEAKKQQVSELKERLDASVAGIVVDYKGITVADDTALRKELREAGVNYTVIKNTIMRRAIEGTSLEQIGDVLEGTTALATSTDDYIAAARVLQKYADNKATPFSIKTGYLDGEIISLEKINSLAKLPSREVLLATVCNAFNAPISAFARVIQAIVDKGGEEAEAAPAAE